METLFYRPVLIPSISVSPFGFSQEYKSAKSLKESLKQDFALTDKVKYFGDSVCILKPYKIENGILSVELEVRKGGYMYHEKREIPIADVVSVEKDLNIILIGKGNQSVTGTITEIVDGKPQESRIYKTAYFQTGIRIGKKNKIIGEHLQFYFARANRRISVGQWYD
ncbi:hypothetical protein [Epilithonimonas hominis]|uniref:hypothetical protein n=1 Tax=Epilithonimonas hominis TaxID=420404 RepID=UPI000ED3729B|nr:hypothetical protein [Epilithonimonas hominis]HAP96051.1 hypothetical protein [Chryseobacterium sp.]